MSCMDFFSLTNEYYSRWLDPDNGALLDKAKEGVHFLYSPARNEIPRGYSACIDLFLYCQDTRIFISYGDRMKDKIPDLKKKCKLDMTAAELTKALSDVCKAGVEHHIKYGFSGSRVIHPGAVVLTDSQTEDFLAFFRSWNPNCRNTDWVPEYFSDMVSQNLCCGVFEDGKLVCCTDAPDMPFMGDRVQEIGIHTLEEYQKRGYASLACNLCIDELIKREKCPLWSTEAGNMASQRLAAKLGFQKIADVLAVSADAAAG